MAVGDCPWRPNRGSEKTVFAVFNWMWQSPS